MMEKVIQQLIKPKHQKLNPRGEPNSSGDYVYGASLNTNASDDNAYAEEVGSVDYNRAIPAKRDSDPTRGAQTYDTDADGGEYHGKTPLPYSKSRYHFGYRWQKPLQRSI